MRPLIVYVDDEKMNHVAFEASLPENWEIISIEDSSEAVARIAKIEPWIVVCDQRMPGKNGNDVLEAIKSIKPYAIRIVTTGYSADQLMIEAISRAGVHDYIVKPWGGDFALRLEKWVAYYESERERRRLEISIRQQSDELEEKNQELYRSSVELKSSLEVREKLLQEMECWVHPFVLKNMAEQHKFPLMRDLSILVTDIIDSGKIHGQSAGGVNLREKVLGAFWETVLKHGGEVESQEGDKAYANFGLSSVEGNHSRAAYAAAKEFRASLEGLSDHYGIRVSCGISLHLAKNCLVCLRQTVIRSQEGIITRKKFDTSSSDVDLAHRMESVTHSLPGTNIIMSREFLRELSDGVKAVDLGQVYFKGQARASEMLLLPSADASAAQVDRFREKLATQGAALAALSAARESGEII
ncbi:MAG: response regulator [Proteobacteria bacterium]|nr:MAG: response regulator [Pseudomonadota bacterium]